MFGLACDTALFDIWRTDQLGPGTLRRSRTTGFGRGDLTGLRATLGNAGPRSGLTVALYLASLEKAKYRDPCWC